VVALRGRFAVCIRQYRPAIEQEVLEIPAGRPEPGEAAEQTARRELLEETSLVAGKLRELASFYNAPCFCDGMTRLFVATGLEPGDSSVHDGEFPTNLVPVDLMEVEQLIYEDVLVDAKTIIALQLARARLEEFR
jgi:ADP-ribose pyrophosphatase